MTMTCSEHPKNVIEDVSDANEAVAATKGVIPSEEGSSLWQQQYSESGNEKKVLLLLSIGLMKQNNEPLFSCATSS